MKTIFLAGGATGIGREIALLFYKNNYNVSFIDINEEKSMEFAKDWDCDRYLFNKCSVVDKASIEKAVKCTLDKFNKIDTLVVNSGIHQKNDILSITDQELDAIMGVNLIGVINTIKAVMPSMIENGGGSIVVNVSDQAFVAKSTSFGYGITKGAVSQLVKSVAVDYGKHGISISGVCAGTILTPLSERLLQQWADNEFGGDINKAINAESELYPAGRIGNPSEVAEFFYYLSNAPFVTGSLHLIDGGLVAGR